MGNIPNWINSICGQLTSVSLMFPWRFVVFLWFQFYGGHPRIYCNLRPGFSNCDWSIWINMFKHQWQIHSTIHTVKSTCSLGPPRPKTNPSADHFQYHAWGSDIRPGSWMRSGDETRVHNDITYYCGNKMTSSRPPETVQWHLQVSLRICLSSVLYGYIFNMVLCSYFLFPS